MRRLILLLAFVISLSSMRASDTLTIRQIYNFDVGDTFNYHLESFGPLYSNPVRSAFTVVITGRWLSPAQDTIYYSRINGAINDTIAYTHLDDLLSLTDTPQYYCPCYEQFKIDSACGSQRNAIFWSNGGNYFDYEYIEGLGKVVGAKGKDDGSQADTTLSSYVKAGISGQTPYYYTAITEIGLSPRHLSLYPNPNTGLLHMTFTEASLYVAHFIIADLLGRDVYMADISERETRHDISRLPSGVYSWRLIGDHGIIKTGKVVKD